MDRMWVSNGGGAYAISFSYRILLVCSIDCSYISGISLLGLPAEMYTYGTQFWMTLVSEVFVAIIMGYAILPVFYKLQITSTYEVGGA